MDRQTPYSADDIDRQDQLDELNPYIPVPVLRASPPWRVRLSDNEGVRMSAHVGPGDLPVPTTEARVVPDAGGGSAFQATGNGEGRNRTGEAPMFSLDELLGMARDGIITDHPAAATASLRNQPPRFRPSLRSREWRESQEGLIRTTLSPQSPRPASTQNLVDLTHGVQERERAGFSMDARPPTALVGALRRRRRIQMANTIIDAVDPDEIMPWDVEGGSASGSDDDHPWVVRSSRPQLYTHDNATRDDLHGWAGNDLRRGGNNRRRQSLLQRDRNRDIETVQMAPGVELRRRSVDINDQEPSEGLEPTNVGTSGDPLVVRSSGTRRARSDDSIDCAPAIKRRRKVSPLRQSIQLAEPLRPDYLRFSTLILSKPLPVRFNQPTRDSRLALGSNKGRPIVTFITDPLPTGTDKDASALRTIHPIPVGCGVHYYEVTVIDRGEEAYMSVGWMKADTDLRRLIGWDKGSWGFHGDDGQTFEERSLGESFADQWNVGDVIGCGIDFSLGKAFFTRNGQMLGHRFKKLGRGLHPAVAMRSPRETFEVNFIGPFSFDIDAYIQCVRDRTCEEAIGIRRSVSRIPRLVDQETLVPPDLAIKNEEVSTDRNSASQAVQVKEETMDLQGPLAPLDASKLPTISPLHDPTAASQAAFVLDHLAHSGRSRAYEILRAGMARRQWLSSATPSYASKITPRLQLIHSSISSSNEPTPWALLNELDPSQITLSSSLHTLLRQLQIQDFIHLLWQSQTIRNGPKKGSAVEADRVEDDAIECGRTLQQRSTTEKWTTVESLYLKEAFGLLSMPQNEWHSIHVADEDYRRDLADRIVQRLRRVVGLRQRSHLEIAVVQTGVVLERLSETDGCAGLVDLGVVLKGRYGGEAEKQGTKKSVKNEGKTEGKAEGGAEQEEEEGKADREGVEQETALEEDKEEKNTEEHVA